MKKLMVAAVLAGSMVAVAEEAAVKPAEAAPAAPAAACATCPAPAAMKRAPLTDEQRAEMRAKREKMMAERKAAMEQKALEVIKKYVPDEEKAKSLLAELEETVMKPIRPPRPMPKKAPKAAAPAEAPKAE